MGRMPEPMCQDVPWGMRPQQRCGPDSGRMAEGCCPEKTPEAPCSRPQTGEEDVPMGVRDYYRLFEKFRKIY